MTSTAPENITTISQADVTALVDLLKTQRTRRLDLVADASALRFDGGRLRINSEEVVIGPDGVTSAGGWYAPTRVFDETLAEALKVPVSYVRKLRDENRLELLDQTVNHFWQGSSDGVNPPDGRKFTARLFTGGETGGGVARALLSDRFRALDNLDVLVTVLQGMDSAGLGPQNITRCDLTERKMYVQVVCPEVGALAPALLKGYRSPFTGKTAEELPQIFAGFVVTNSETGDGAVAISPRLTVQVCNNGMTITKEAMRAIHVGTRKSEGVIAYSEETQAKELELVALKARDAVATFLDVEYVKAKIAELEADAGVKVTKPESTIKAVMQATLIPMGLQESILEKFISGGQSTAGGIMQAVTAVAQTVDDADRAYELEALAPNVLRHAARLAARG